MAFTDHATSSEVEFPPDGQDLARFAGTPALDSEAYLYLAMLNTLADTRFPADELRRYVRSRYVLSDADFDALLLNFENEALRARDTWVASANAEVERQLSSDRYAIVQTNLDFEPLTFRCELTLELSPAIEERDALFELVNGLKLVAATLSVPAGGRTVGARLLELAVFHRPEGLGYSYVLRASIHGSKARDLRTADIRTWLSKAEAKVNPIVNDLLVRFLKPKLVALRLANGGLNSLNRFLRRRK